MSLAVTYRIICKRYATQIGFPAYVSLIHTAQISAFCLKLDGYEILSRSISHGTTIGFASHPFATARWKQGWQLSVAEWRQRLAVTLPADRQPYGLEPVFGGDGVALQQPTP